MKTVTVDKIGSVTKNLNLGHEIELLEDTGVAMGDVFAAEVLDDKKIYNELELPSGRMSKLKRGDRIVVALGERMALKGFVGRLPKKLRPGDALHLLNLGGVSGECTSANKHEVGEPLRIKILGAVARNGKPLNIGDAVLFKPENALTASTPLIITTGTSMDSGKTTVAAEMTKTLTRLGMKLAGTKLTGVGMQRDIYKMMDYGVREAVSFVDAGITSTANIDAELVKKIARGAINHLSQSNPDAIMIEFGDGVMGRYGVREILSDADIRGNVYLHIGCAGDPVGAVKLHEECQALGVPLDIIAGPVTDNSVGQELVREATNLVTYNAFNPTNDWLDVVIGKWTKETSGRRLSA